MLKVRTDHYWKDSDAVLLSDDQARGRLVEAKGAVSWRGVNFVAAALVVWCSQLLLWAG